MECGWTASLAAHNPFRPTTQPLPMPRHVPARSLRQYTALARLDTGVFCTPSKSLRVEGAENTATPHCARRGGAQTVLKCEYVYFNLAAPPLLLSSKDRATHTPFNPSARSQEPLHYQSGGSSFLLSPLSLTHLAVNLPSPFSDSLSKTVEAAHTSAHLYSYHKLLSFVSS